MSVRAERQCVCVCMWPVIVLMERVIRSNKSWKLEKYNDLRELFVRPVHYLLTCVAHRFGQSRKVSARRRLWRGAAVWPHIN